MRLKPSARLRTIRRYYDRHFTTKHSCIELKCEEHLDAKNKAWVNGKRK